MEDHKVILTHKDYQESYCNETIRRINETNKRLIKKYGIKKKQVITIEKAPKKLPIEVIEVKSKEKDGRYSQGYSIENRIKY